MKKGTENEAEAEVGVGGEEVWTFRAIGEGETEASFEEVRPWETDTPPIDSIAFSVNITKE